MIINKLSSFNITIEPPPDKGIMQRAVIIGAMKGGIEIENPSFCGDCQSAIACIKSLGATVEIKGNVLTIGGLPSSSKGVTFVSGTSPVQDVTPPVRDVTPPTQQKILKLNAGNSATALRLILGMIAGLGIEAQLTGDESLSSRSMRNTIEALEAMGAKISHNNYFAPITNHPSTLRGIEFIPTQPSAQVKSATILASEASNNITTIIEKIRTRDHTERLLTHIKNGGKRIKIKGDISAAAYPIALALLTKNGFAHIRNVGLNPLRTGMVEVLKNANANITLIHKGEEGGEPFGDIIAEYSPCLKPFYINEEILPTLIDEVPLLAVIASMIEGESHLYNLTILRNKESDRLQEIARYLNITPFKDSLYIKGKLKIDYPVITSNDHRIIMAMAVLGALNNGCEIKNPHMVEVSDINFFQYFCK